MVQISAALRFDHAAHVVFETSGIGIHRDGNWLLHHCFHECIHIIRLNILVTSHTSFGDANGTGGHITGLSSFSLGRLVRIAFLSAHVGALSILEGWVLVTAIASILTLAFRAIHQLLLRQ